MPEFILDYGTAESARAFRALDAFTQGYIEAMFFTDCEHGSVSERETTSSRVRVWNPETDSSLPGDVSFADLAPAALARIGEDCDAFISIFDKIEARVDHGQTPNWPDDAQAGRDFWYTRNGHGCGFWDGDWPEPFASELTAAAKAFPQVDSCLGDDGLIYLS